MRRLLLLALFIASTACAQITNGTTGLASKSSDGKLADAQSTVGAYVQLNLKCDGTTDQLAKIQAAIDGYREVFIPAQSATCMISGRLSFPSNRILRTARGNVIKLANGSLQAPSALQGMCFATNSDYDNGNSWITIDGGEWDCNAANQTRVDSPYVGGVGFRFRNVANLTIRNLTITDPKAWSVMIIQSTHVLVENLFFKQPNNQVNQDGVHIVGPSSRIVIRNLMGLTNDDTVALSADDVSYASPVYGDIADVLIEGIFNSGAGPNCVRIVAASHSVSDVQIRNVDRHVNISKFGFAGSAQSKNILIDGIRQGGSITADTNISNLIVRNTVMNGPLTVGSVGTIGQLVLDGVQSSGLSGPLVSVAGSVADLSVKHVSFSSTVQPLAGTTGAGTITAFHSDPIMSATDPGCTVAWQRGVQWFDTTTTTTVPKVCMLVAGTPTWVTTSYAPHCAKYTVAYGSLTAAAPTQVVDLVSVPAATKLVSVTIKEGTQFTSGSVTALTASVGNKTGTVVEYAPAYPLMQVVGDSQYYDSQVYGSATWAAHTISAKFTATSANLSALSAGSVDIWLCTEVLP